MRRILQIAGSLLILLAFTANLIGLDHDSAWGANRYLLLFTGLSLIILSFALHMAQSRRIPADLTRRLSAVWERIFGNLWISVLLGAFLLSSVAVYAVWFTTNGTFNQFVRTLARRPRWG